MLRWLGVLVILIGCGGRAKRVHGPNDIWLSDIRIKGNKTIPEDDLVPGLAIDRARRDGLPVDPYLLGLDTKRIRGEYTRMGFFDAKVDSRIEREDNAEIVIFTIEEGPRAKALVTVTGLPAELAEETVLDKLELKNDAPFEYELYDDGKEIVKAMVEEVGYPYVDLEDSVVTVDRPTKVAAVSYRVVLGGPRATFGKVTVTGLSEFPDLERAVHGRLAFVEGDLYSPSVLAETSRSLYDLGRFAQVRVGADRKAGGEVIPVIIEVSVAGRHEIKFGGGFGYEPATYETRFRTGFSYIPEEYPLLSLNFDGRLAASINHDFDDLEPKLRLFFNVQRLELFKPFVIGDFGAGYDIFTIESYSSRGPNLRLGLTAPLGKRWLKGQFAWNLSYLEFFDVNELIGRRDQQLFSLRENERNGRFEQSIAADLRDKSLEPRKGVYIGLRIIEGGFFAGGAFDYFEIQPDLRAYLPIRKLSSIAFRVRGGAFFGEVPATQRYFSGGAQNHRGFGARELAPIIRGAVLGTDGEPVINPDGSTLTDTTPIGGEVFLETGAELRIPLGEWSGLMFGTTVFVDGGDVVQKDEGIDLRNLHWAAGVGMFVKYGGFKVRIDVGQRLTRTGPGELEHDPDGLLKNTNFFLGVGETY